MDMDAFLKTIGVMVLSAIIVSIPLLCGLSFVLGWYPESQFFLVIGTLLVFGFVAFALADKQ